MMVLRVIVNYRVNFNSDSRTVLLLSSIRALARAPYFQTMEPQTCAMQVRLQTPFRLPDKSQGFGRQPGQFPIQLVMHL